MTAPTNTFLSTAAIGNREDLTDAIYRITPTATPFMSLAAKGKATNTLHEWQTQDLAAISLSNLAAEGDDAVAAAVTPTVRLNNRTAISTKTISLAGTQQAVNSAGNSNTFGYQMAMKSLELRNDMEAMATQLDVTATAPRQARGLRGWVVDNIDSGAGYVAASYTGNTATTDGTQVAFTEARLKNVLQKVYTAGGEPDVIMVNTLAKQTFSSFSGNATRMIAGEDSKLVASIDVYVSDFGELKVVPNRRIRQRDAFVLQSDKWAISYLRPFQTVDLAKTGDADRKQVLVEWTVEARAPKSNGAIYDIL